MMQLTFVLAEKCIRAEALEKALRLARVQNLARKLFPTNEAITQWLCKPEPALANRVPLDLLNTDGGDRQVENVLHSLAYGQFL